jgi:hypothetical protein
MTSKPANQDRQSDDTAATPEPRPETDSQAPAVATIDWPGEFWLPEGTDMSEMLKAARERRKRLGID